MTMLEVVRWAVLFAWIGAVSLSPLVVLVVLRIGVDRIIDKRRARKREAGGG